jgi:hypothetical protein
MAKIFVPVSIRAVPDRRRSDANPQRRTDAIPVGNENQMQSATPEQGEAMTNEYAEFGKTMAERGVLQGGERLRSVSDATTVRVRNGQVLATDGPFAETKEQLGGHYVVECKDLDEAIEVASKIPGARTGSIEVRPIGRGRGRRRRRVPRRMGQGRRDHLLPAARGDMLRRLGRRSEAAEAYRKAHGSGAPLLRAPPARGVGLTPV